MQLPNFKSNSKGGVHKTRKRLTYDKRKENMSGTDMFRNKGMLNFVTFEDWYTTVNFFDSLVIP